MTTPPVGYRAKVGTHKNNVCGNPLKIVCILFYYDNDDNAAAGRSGLTAIGRKVESTAVGYVNAFLVVGSGGVGGGADR